MLVANGAWSSVGETSCAPGRWWATRDAGQMAVPADADRELALADEALARFQVDAAVAHLSAAVRILTEAQQPRLAAMASIRLGEVMGTFLGNSTAARAWFARAWRLVEHEPVCVEQGWVAVAPMGCEVPDPADLLRAAELALDRARRFGDVNLETKALADAGLAHVQAGRLPRAWRCSTRRWPSPAGRRTPT